MLNQIRTRLNEMLPVAVRPNTMVNRYLSRYLSPQPVILKGPFQGMRYTTKSVGSVLTPKVLGTYEVELNPILHSFSSTEPRVFVDVGAAEGYFAAGLAWSNPSSKVIAFEGEEAGRGLMAELGRLNGLSDRIEIRGFCARADLMGILETCTPALVIVDIEGGEEALLSCEVCERLDKSDLIVELHPWVVPDVESILTSRFKRTHRVNVVRARNRVVSDLPFGFITNNLMARWVLPQLDELRPEPMRWLHLVAK